jgi:hypothetical protein
MTRVACPVSARWPSRLGLEFFERAAVEGQELDLRFPAPAMQVAPDKAGEVCDREREGPYGPEPVAAHFGPVLGVCLAQGRVDARGCPLKHIGLDRLSRHGDQQPVVGNRLVRRV